MHRRVLLVTPNFQNNSLGRTYCLWLLCRELGWQTRVVGVKGDTLWPALAGSDFAADCVLPSGSADDRKAALVEHVEWSDVVVAVKPLPTSFGVALELIRRHAAAVRARHRRSRPRGPYRLATVAGAAARDCC